MRGRKAAQQKLKTCFRKKIAERFLLRDYEVYKMTILKRGLEVILNVLGGIEMSLVT